MAGKPNLLIICLALAGAVRADTVLIKSAANGQYLGRADDGVTLAANAATADAAETFEQLYPGNGYFILLTGSTGAYVTFADTAQASAMTPHGADLMSASAPRGADGAIAIKLKSTGKYLTANPVVTASAASASDDSAWFIIERVSTTAASVSVDFTDPRQTITGFGAAVAYYGNWLTSHPNKQEIYAALFDPVNGLGASVLRLQNVFRYQPNPNFDPDSVEIVAQAATVRGGAPIAVEMTSWTPPASLKSNGAEGCPGTKNCTLAMKNGAFDYDGLAAYWADSITAYRNLGVNPTWISLQNEPDWIADYGSCRFDPAESVVGGIRYAGYNKALDAVAARLNQLDSPPKIVGPEILGVGYNDLPNYMAQLDASKIDVVAHHLYHGGNEKSPDTFNPVFESIQAAHASKPRFQTEFGRGDGFQTAWLIHNSLVVEEASAYLYWGAIWPDRQNLIYVDFPWDRSRWTTDRGWQPNDQYYALEHFSRFVQPGFQRFTALTNQAGLRVSGFASPDQARVVIVALNTTDAQTDVAIAFDGIAARISSIYRTGFGDTAERFASLGSLDSGSMVSIGAHSAVTIVLDLPPSASASAQSRVVPSTFRSSRGLP